MALTTWYTCARRVFLPMVTCAGRARPSWLFTQLYNSPELGSEHGSLMATSSGVNMVLLETAVLGSNLLWKPSQWWHKRLELEGCSGRYLVFPLWTRWGRCQIWLGSYSSNSSMLITLRYRKVSEQWGHWAFIQGLFLIKLSPIYSSTSPAARHSAKTPLRCARKVPRFPPGASPAAWS